MAQRIGVIGGSGFIGAWLVEALLGRGHDVRVIDKAPSARHPQLWTAAEVRDPVSLAAACTGCEMLYNLAAEHRDDVRPRSLYHEVNVAGARHTCAVATQLGIQRLVFTSTVAVYGLVAAEVDESAPLRPFNDYGRTKLEAEQVFRAWAAADHGRQLTIVRPTVVFGPGNRGNVYNLLAQIARGRHLVIGDGRNRKSMAYVGNVADFLAYASQFGPGVQLYNYVDKPDLDMNELVVLAGRTLGRDRQPYRLPYGLALASGQVLDLVARLTGLRFPLSAARVRKYGAASQFAARQLTSSGFVPGYDLRASLIATIRHEFGTGPGAMVRDPAPAE